MCREREYLNGVVWLWIGLVLCSVVLMTGCGKKTAVYENTAEYGGQNDWEELAKSDARKYREQKRVDVTAVEWKIGETREQEEYFRQEQFLSPVIKHAVSEAWEFCDLVAGGYYFSVYQAYSQEGNGDYTPGYYVDRLDFETMEQQTCFYRDDIFSLGAIAALDYSGKELYGCFESFDEDGLISRVFLCSLLEDGTVGPKIDITKALAEKDLLPKNAYFLFQCNVHYNEERQEIYLTALGDSGLYVISTTGELLYDFRGFDEKQQEISIYGLTETGECIFLAYDSAGKESIYFTILGSEEGVRQEVRQYRVKKLCTEESNVNRLHTHPYIDGYGNLIYLENGGTVINWNVETGTRQKLFAGPSNFFADAVAIVRNAEGKLCVLARENEGFAVSIYSASGPAVQVRLTLETTDYIDDTVINMVKRFEQTHPGVTIEIGPNVENYNEKDIRRNQIYQDIVKGEGSDLIWITGEELDDFLKGEALMDMSGTVTGEEEQKLISGVLEYGQRDGKQYFFANNVVPETVVVNGEIWDKSIITVTELLDLADACEREYGEAFQLILGNSGFCRYWTLLDFFTKDLYHSDFVDWDNYQCDFTGKEFRRVLEVCKKYDERAQHSNADGEVPDTATRVQCLLEGEVLLLWEPWSMDFPGFSRMQALLGEKCNMVGYPIREGEQEKGFSGNRLSLGNGLVVNKNTKNREIVEEFIRCLYSYDYQRYYISGYAATPIRKDVLQNSLMVDREGNWGLRIDSHTRRPVDAKPNKESYMDEYCGFLDSCEPLYNEKQIKAILREESKAYFAGEKSLDQTVENIQNRVSLYLGEIQK